MEQPRFQLALLTTWILALQAVVLLPVPQCQLCVLLFTTIQSDGMKIMVNTLQLFHAS